MCWVIPPASPLATEAERRLSNSVVFPWSTWPIIVTMGGLRGSFEASMRGGLHVSILVRLMHSVGCTMMALRRVEIKCRFIIDDRVAIEFLG